MSNNDDLIYMGYLVTSDKVRLNKLCNAFDDRWNNPFDNAKPVRIKGSEEITHWVIGTELNGYGVRLLNLIQRSQLPAYLANRGIVQADVQDLPKVLISFVTEKEKFQRDYNRFLSIYKMELALL